MPTTLAISGKGGSGKTTIAAMIIRLLLEQQNSAVLAVDADPNSCLGLTMGVQPVGTIAEIREQARAKSPASPGMDRVRSFEYGIQQAITEADGFDLLTMGRPEGPDCYCAVNNLLRTFLDKLSSQYKFVIIDNEAGMEHLSRRTTNNVDFLCIVAEATALGVLTAKRIFNLARQLPISVKRIGVIWNGNRGSPPEPPDTNDEIETFGYIPYDKAILDASMQGKTVFDLQQSSPAFSAVQKILKHILVLSSSRTMNNEL
jgi:CO dehydrogenase maturation factor